MPGQVAQVFHVIEIEIAVKDLPNGSALGYTIANETALHYLNDHTTAPESWEHWITVHRGHRNYTVKWRKPLKKGEHV